MAQPASENARKLAALISDELKISIESANKSANSDEKSANKSADSNKESADVMVALNKRQTQILTIMEDDREYTTEAIASEEYANPLLRESKVKVIIDMVYPDYRWKTTGQDRLILMLRKDWRKWIIMRFKRK